MLFCTLSWAIFWLQSRSVLLRSLFSEGSASRLSRTFFGYFGRVCCLGPQRKALATTAKIVPIHPSPIAPYTTRKNIAPRGPGSNVARKPNTQNAAIGRQIATRMNFSRCFMTWWLLRPNGLESYNHHASLNTLVCRHSLFALVPTHESRNH